MRLVRAKMLYGVDVVRLTAEDYLEGSVLRNARKGHICIQCGDFIRKGDQYVHYSDADPPIVGDKYCLVCAAKFLRPIEVIEVLEE